MALKNVKILLL